jgi:hypothetical protein
LEEKSMNKLFVAVFASALALASAATFADDRTPWNVTPPEQAKMKQEADAKKSAFAKMTPEEKPTARKASHAEHQKYQDTIIKLTQNPGETRNMGINKSAAASKAGPTPPRGMINMAEAEKPLLKQKGQ